MTIEQARSDINIHLRGKAPKETREILKLRAEVSVLKLAVGLFNEGAERSEKKNEVLKSELSAFSRANDSLAKELVSLRRRCSVLDARVSILQQENEEYLKKLTAWRPSEEELPKIMALMRCGGDTFNYKSAMPYSEKTDVDIAAQVDLEEDAKRYRYLREYGASVTIALRVSIDRAGRGHSYNVALTGDSFEEAVDRAIERKKNVL